MPIGAPLYRPDPKSACTVLVGPMVLTQAAELAAIGNWSTGVFHMLSIGRTGQPPILGAWPEAVERATKVSAKANTADCGYWDINAPRCLLNRARVLVILYLNPRILEQ